MNTQRTIVDYQGGIPSRSIERKTTTHRSTPARIRYKILRRDGFRCQYCGKTAEDTDLEVDHIMPKAKGGTDDETNLITACKDCNRGKYTEDIVQPPRKCPKCEGDIIYKAGFAIRKGGCVQSYKCRGCGHSFTDKKSIHMTTEQRPEEHKKKSLMEQGTKIGVN